MRCANVMLSYGLFLSVALLGCEKAFGQWQSLNGGVNNSVRAFAISPDSSRLLLAGNFPFVQQNDLRVNNMVWWDGENWSIDGLAGGNGDTSLLGSTSPVLSLVVHGDTVFVGHLSDYWQGQQVLGHATMLVDGQWEPCANPNSIFYFLEANGRMFSGGVSDELYGQYAPGIYEWLGSSWQDIPNMPFTSLAQVNDVAYWQGQYYFGGVFQVLGSRKMLAFDGVDQWNPLAGGVGGNFVETICGYGDSLYVGGFMLPGQDVQSQHIQIWDGTQWLPFFSEVFASGKVRDVQEFEGALYISGGFKFGSDTTQYGLIRYDGQQICALGGYMIHGGSRMAFFKDDLYMDLPPANTQLGYEYIGRLDLETVVPDTCVLVTSNSVNELSQPEQFRINPNPANSEITVTLVAPSSGPWVVLIRDALGQIVHEQRVSGAQRAIIALDGLMDGFYTAHVRSSAGETASKFIIQRH